MLSIPVSICVGIQCTFALAQMKLNLRAAAELHNFAWKMRNCATRLVCIAEPEQSAVLSTNQFRNLWPTSPLRRASARTPCIILISLSPRSAVQCALPPLKIYVIDIYWLH